MFFNILSRSTSTDLAIIEALRVRAFLFLIFGTPLQVSVWMKKPSNRREKL